MSIEEIRHVRRLLISHTDAQQTANATVLGNLAAIKTMLERKVLAIDPPVPRQRVVAASANGTVPLMPLPATQALTKEFQERTEYTSILLRM